MSDDERNLLRYYAETDRIIHGQVQTHQRTPLTGLSSKVNNFNPQNDTIELDHFANIQNAQELAAAITPDMHGNAVLELGHGDSIAMPGVSAVP